MPVLPIRLSDVQYEVLQKSAEAAGQKLSVWARGVLLGEKSLGATVVERLDEFVDEAALHKPPVKTKKPKTLNEEAVAAPKPPEFVAPWNAPVKKWFCKCGAANFGGGKCSRCQADQP